MKKFLNVLSNVFITLLLIFSITMTVIVISSTRNEDRIPSLFGYALFNVETDSMIGENGFDPGSLIVIRKVDKEEANNLKVGDVVTFRRIFQGQEYLDTHRIVEFPEEVIRNSEFVSEKEIVDGVWLHGDTHYYVTRGDNTPAIDYMDNGDVDYLSYNEVVGVWTGTKIPGLGSALKFLKSQLGFMLCIVLPVALFFIYELYVFIVTLTSKKKEEALAEVEGKEAELKAKAVAEFLAQQNAAQQEEPRAEPEKPAEAPEVSEEEKAKIIAEYMAKQADTMRNQEKQ